MTFEDIVKKYVAQLRVVERLREEARNYSSANTNGTLFYEEECLERLAEDLKKAVDELEK